VRVTDDRCADTSLSKATGQTATLREHKHPFVRYAYVLTVTRRVTNTAIGRSQVYRTGEFIIEAIWTAAPR
jgi:hypothetical protein